MGSAERSRVRQLVLDFLDEGVHIDNIAWYLRSDTPFDPDLLAHALESAISHQNLEAVKICALAAADQFNIDQAQLIETVFLPAIRNLHSADDTSWIRTRVYSWMGKPILLALTESQARELLQMLVTYPEFDHDLENVVAAISRNWPGAVLDWLGERQAFARSEQATSRYDAMPFEVYELKRYLAARPDMFLRAARAWFDEDPTVFPYDGGRLLASVFPELPAELSRPLEVSFLAEPDTSVEFVLAVLQAFEGKPCVYGPLRIVVASLQVGSVHLQMARAVIEAGGVVSGEFGFADQATQRRDLIALWCDDPSETVRAFTAEMVRDLGRTIAVETRRAEQSVAMRRLAYSEELIDHGVGGQTE